MTQLTSCVSKIGIANGRTFTDYTYSPIHYISCHNGPSLVMQEYNEMKLFP